MNNPNPVFKKSTTRVNLTTNEEIIKAFQKKDKKLENKVSELQKRLDENAITLKELSQSVEDRDKTITNIQLTLERNEVAKKHLQTKINELENTNGELLKKLATNVNESTINNYNVDTLISTFSPKFIHDFEEERMKVRVRVGELLKKETQIVDVVKLFLEAYKWKQYEANDLQDKEEKQSNLEKNEEDVKKRLPKFQLTPRCKDRSKKQIE